MSELLKLADRCEAASEPDRELDEAIAVGSGDYLTGVGREGMFAHRSKPNQFGGFVPAYTTSLDAAMTLVPEGWLLATLNERNASGEWNWRWKAELWDCKADRSPGQDAPHVRGVARAAHASKCAPALALCAAALRARDALTNSEAGGGE